MGHVWLYHAFPRAPNCCLGVVMKNLMEICEVSQWPIVPVNMKTPSCLCSGFDCFLEVAGGKRASIGFDFYSWPCQTVCILLLFMLLLWQKPYNESSAE